MKSLVSAVIKERRVTESTKCTNRVDHINVILAKNILLACQQLSGEFWPKWTNKTMATG